MFQGRNPALGPGQQFPVAWVSEKVIQLSEYEILGFGVLICELEHHGPDEDLSAAACGVRTYPGMQIE